MNRDDIINKFKYYFLTFSQHYFDIRQDSEQTIQNSLITIVADLKAKITVPNTASELIAALMMYNVWEYDSSLHIKERKHLFLRLFRKHPDFIALSNKDKNDLLTEITTASYISINQTYSNIFFQQLFSNEALIETITNYLSLDNNTHNNDRKTISISQLIQKIDQEILQVKPENNYLGALSIITNNQQLADYALKALRVMLPLQAKEKLASEEDITQYLAKTTLRKIDYQAIYLCMQCFNNVSPARRLSGSPQINHLLEDKFYASSTSNIIKYQISSYLPNALAIGIAILLIFTGNIFYALPILLMPSLIYYQMYYIALLLLLPIHYPDHKTSIMTTIINDIFLCSFMLWCKKFYTRLNNNLISALSFKLHYEAMDHAAPLIVTTSRDERNAAQKTIEHICKIIELLTNKNNRAKLLPQIVERILLNQIYGISGQSTLCILKEDEENYYPQSYTRSLILHFFKYNSITQPKFIYDPQKKTTINISGRSISHV